jgi:hypothetical protein
MALGLAALSLCLAADAVADKPSRDPAADKPGRDPAAPPQAVAAGFATVAFNADFRVAGYLGDNLSCATAAQLKTWKQGMYWEGQNSPAGVAPCDLITIVNDPVLGSPVLDLAWVAARVVNQGEDDVSISTFPLDHVSPSYAFRHGYVEIVARFPGALTTKGYFAALWAVADEPIRGQNLPPWNWPLGAAEHDYLEIVGPVTLGNPQPTWDAAVHEWDAGGTAAFLANGVLTGVFDPTQPHKYGWLWTTGGEYQFGQVCAYRDDQKVGCVATTAYSEAFNFALVLTMQVSCNANGYTDRSCISVPRMDALIQRVTIFQQ